MSVFKDHDLMAYGPIDAREADLADTRVYFENLLRESDDHPWAQEVRAWLLKYHNIWFTGPRTWREIAASALRQEAEGRRRLFHTTRELWHADGVERPLNQEIDPIFREYRRRLKLVGAGIASPLGLVSQSHLHHVRPERVDNGYLYAFHRRAWLPLWLSPMQIDAQEYTEACRKLQASEAGRKAKQLLFDNLNDIQRHDYLTKGIFITASSPDERNMKTLYIIDNSYPNGNIFEIKQGQVTCSYCFHPAEPYPLDDILLSQKLVIENDLAELKEMGNRTERERRVLVPTMRGYVP